MRQLIRRVWYLLRHRRFQSDLAEEMDFHRVMKERQLQESGVEPAAAAFAARRALGSLALAQDRVRDVWVPRWLQGLGQDVGLGVRALLATPVVTTVAVLSLALGIGANTAIFSIVNSLLLRPLPVMEPQRLVTVSSAAAANEQFPSPWPYAIWEQIHRRSEAFDGACAWSLFMQEFNLAQGGETQPVAGVYVSGDFFSTLGVPALLGRTFTAADDVRGGGPDGPVAVISYGLWQRRFGGAADVVGRPLVLERIPFRIVGVSPPEFLGTEVGRSFDVAVPIGTEPLIRGKDTRLDFEEFSFLMVMLRLKPTQSIDKGTATIRGVQRQIGQAAAPQDRRFQEEFLKDPLVLVSAATGTSLLRHQYARPLYTIFAILALVLFIACANIANLLLARATTRRHELSVRVALGAPRWRLARQLLIESLVLAGAGAVFGQLVALWGSRALVAQLSTPIERVVLDLPLDGQVLAFTAAVTIGTVLLFGTAPAFRATRVDPMYALKEPVSAGRPVTGSRHGSGVFSGRLGEGTSSGFLVVQMALSLVLIVAAGLLVRTFERLATLPPGFDSDRVLVTHVNVAGTRVDPADRIAFYRRLVDAVAEAPGVAHAAASDNTPFSGGLSMIAIVDVPGGPPLSERERTSQVVFVTPGWFAAYGMGVRAGRDVNDRDTKDAPPVLLVNEAFERKFFPNRNAVGGIVADTGGGPGPARKPKIIVGVVRDAAYYSLRDQVFPTMYQPWAQFDFGSGPAEISISVRPSAESPLLVARSVATTLTTVDRDLAFSFRPLADQVNASLIQERLVAMLSGFFAGLALLLAALGLYGVTYYTVTRRRTEIGIRMALGAQPARVVQLVLSRVLILTGIGIVIGAGVSVWASQFVASLLYGFGPRDPVTLVGAAVVLATVGALAGWLPAWRASRIDPAQVLRDQ